MILVDTLIMSTEIQLSLYYNARIWIFIKVSLKHSRSKMQTQERK